MAIVGGAAIAGGASLAGSMISSSAASDAAGQQAQAATNAANAQLSSTQQTNALQYQMYLQNLMNQAPSLQAGQTALAALMGGYNLPLSSGSNLVTNTPSTNMPGIGTIGAQNYGASQAQLDQANRTVGGLGQGYFAQQFTPSSLTLDPSYQFRLQQGEQALQASAAAKGTLMTGQGLKDITNYGQQAASQEYQAAYDRFMNTQQTQFNRLASLAGITQPAASGMSGVSTGQGIASNTLGGMSQANNYLTSGATAASAGTIASANAWNRGLSQLGGIATNAYNQYQQQPSSYGQPGYNSSFDDPAAYG